jgi:hypothetical protein
MSIHSSFEIHARAQEHAPRWMNWTPHRSSLPGRWESSPLKYVVYPLLAIAASTAMAAAQPVRWTTFSISQTGTSVQIPSSIFSERAGQPDGFGQRFETADGRAELTIQSVPRRGNETPATFLAERHPPAHLQYKRVTPQFFAVSSYKRDVVWYNRCNFSQRFVHCVLINYPAREERA